MSNGVALQQAALSYVQDYGFVLCSPTYGTKAPTTPGWNTEAAVIRDPDTVRRTWDGRTPRNIGLIHQYSGTCSLDIDHAEYAAQALAGVGLNLDTIRRGIPCVQGQPGRYRLLFRQPAGVVLQPRKLIWSNPHFDPQRPPGTDNPKTVTVLELRCGTQQDVLPPSRHPSSRDYEWLHPLPDAAAELPEPPPALVELWQSWPSWLSLLTAACPWAPTAPEPRAKSYYQDDGAKPDVIGAFNRAHDVRSLLERHGYKPTGEQRWLSPNSQSGLAGVVLLDSGRVYSHHAGDPFSDGHSHDAFGVYCLLEHGGDVRQAVRAAAELLGTNYPAERVREHPDNLNPPAAEGDEPGEATLARLAALSPLEYDRARMAEAQRLGVRTKMLDREVERRRAPAEPPVPPDDDAGLFPPVEPWPEPVTPQALLDDLLACAQRFLVMDEPSRVALVLWAVFTYFIDAMAIAPLLGIFSPVKRCGKTTVLVWLTHLVARPLLAASITPAALFRAMERWTPTLLIDEADTFLVGNNELRGVLNSGHTRKSAFVIRTVGDDHEPRRFSTWGAKAIALIGELPDTLADRAIPIVMRRKLPAEMIERLRHGHHQDEFTRLARRCVRFAADHREVIRQARPVLPTELHDRAQDNWEPLLAIADLAGPDWGERARQAAVELTQSQDAAGVGGDLLRDIQAIFIETGAERLFSQDLLDRLCEDPEARWATYNQGSRGGALTPRQLARMLKQFGIATHRTIRIGDATAKGYERGWFDEAFHRYLTPAPSDRYSLRVTGSQASG